MTTTDHLQRIRTKCMELLEIASKRTPGKWVHRQGEYCSHWISRADNLSNIAEIPTASSYTASEISENAGFIASCADSAEAGWKATITAIDWILSSHAIPDVYSQDCVDADVEELSASILAAWPEELL